MLVDSIYDKSIPVFDIKGSLAVKKIQNAIVATGDIFRKYIEEKDYQPESLNEKELTQEFIVFINRILYDEKIPFKADKDYIDIYTPGSNTKREVDMYFYSLELNASTESLFSVEAKRLPAPDNSKKREKEYVIGYKKNKGGIERFKNEEHGKGLLECGMLAFVEDETPFTNWLAKINSWIEELTYNKNSDWQKDEKLGDFEEDVYFAKSYSKVNRKQKDLLSLFHFWIRLV